ncbi:MAG TPA: hypothetical protein VFQ95_02215 [Rhodanobacteraceae bacterium]|nr:hypothetical protein [Rhodanobacteraceae bacterium]
MSRISEDPRRALENALYGRHLNRLRKLAGWDRIRRRAATASTFLSTEHDYVLCRGGVPFGPRKRMLGRTALALNRDFEDAYAAKCIAEPKRRLWRWKLKPESESGSAA